jgi:2'-5' RNA ligase
VDPFPDQVLPHLIFLISPMAKTESLKLYFIALIPPDPVCSEIISMKRQIKEQYNSKAALRSPPHITLFMPFKSGESKIRSIKNSLANLSSQFPSISIKTDGFGCFRPRVIFINILKNDLLTRLHKAVHDSMKKEHHIFDSKDNPRPFNPHITIAFRDLKKQQFSRAWPHYQDMNFNREFVFDRLTLLRHNGKFWEESDAYFFTRSSSE